MIQTAAILTRTGSIQVELPAADIEVMDGVQWGSVDAFPTPAYWAYQVVARRLVGKPAGYRLGRTLAEEVAACLLGGYGIPATVGLAAYDRMRERGALSGNPVSEKDLEALLKEPLEVGGKSIRYRFAAQKARYLAAALPLAHAAPEFNVGRQLRDWLLVVPGIGHKTASWIARNWLDANDVAILDIHIMRVGQVIGLFPKNLTVERNYAELEERFLRLSTSLDVRASELDAVIWWEMASSPLTVRHLIEYLRGSDENKERARPRKHVQTELALSR
jgi:thermostable 8-oxoguanine DNA glycosylase